MYLLETWKKGSGGDYLAAFVISRERVGWLLSWSGMDPSQDDVLGMGYESMKRYAEIDLRMMSDEQLVVSLPTAAGSSQAAYAGFARVRVGADGVIVSLVVVDPYFDGWLEISGDAIGRMC